MRRFKLNKKGCLSSWELELRVFSLSLSLLGFWRQASSIQMKPVLTAHWLTLPRGGLGLILFILTVNIHSLCPLYLHVSLPACSLP